MITMANGDIALTIGKIDINIKCPKKRTHKTEILRCKDIKKGVRK